MFYRTYCKKKRKKRKKNNFLAPTSLFLFFLNCKINPKAVGNSRIFVVVCSFVMAVHQTPNL